MITPEIISPFGVEETIIRGVLEHGSDAAIVVATQAAAYTGDFVLDVEVAKGIAHEPLDVALDHDQWQWLVVPVTGC
jgi:hypothetical protein